jgi:carbon monoxide dehydrogenase subunit G
VKIVQKFEVNASPRRVWEFLVDPYRVVGCLPGATINEKVDAKTYAGTITVRVGLVTASYKGRLCFERLDPETHEAEIVAQGQDVRGKGSAEMRMASHLSPLEGGGTEVTVRSEVAITGLLAQFGRGMIQEVSDQLFQQFIASLKEKLETGADTAPAPGKRGSLNVLALGSKVSGRVLRKALRRIFGLEHS